MIKSVILSLLTGYAVLLIAGCASIMTHSGGHQGYYSGTHANVALLKDDNTSWALLPFVAIDLPFSAAVDTLLLPYDYLHSAQDSTLGSPRERIKKEEAKNSEFTLDNATLSQQIQ